MQRFRSAAAAIVLLAVATPAAAQDAAARLQYAHAVYRSHVEFQNGNVARALELLDSCDAKLRGWEWSYVRRLCRPELFSLPAAKVDARTHAFRSATFSPDGRTILTANGSKSATTWSAATGARESDLADDVVILHARYSEDGKRIVTTGEAATASVWDAKTGKKLVTLKRERAIGPANFSPDGKRVVTSCHRELTIWNAETGQEIRTFASAAFDQCRPSFSPDGTRIVADGFGGSAMFDAEKGVRVFDIKSGGNNTETYSRFSPDGKTIAVSYTDGTCRLHDAATGDEIRTLKGHANSVRSAAYSPDGKRIVTGGGDRTLRIWDAESGRELSSRRTSGSVADAVFDREGQRILGLEGDAVKVWPAEASRNRELQSPLGGWITDMKYAADGKRLAVANNAGIGFQVEIWDIEAGKMLTTIADHDYMVHAVMFSPDGKRLLSRTGTGRTKIFDAETGKRMHDLSGTGQTSVNIHAAFSRDAKSVLTVKAGEIHAWSLKNGERLQTLKSKRGGANKVWESPDGKTIIGLVDWRHLQTWNAATGEPAGDVELQEPPAKPGNAWLSPDSSRLFLASSGEPVRCFDAKSGKALYTLTGAKLFNEEQFAISPDGTRLATTHSGDTSVHIWDAAGGEELLVVPCHTKGIACVAFSGDGVQLAAAPTEGPIRILNGAPVKN